MKLKIFYLFVFIMTISASQYLKGQTTPSGYWAIYPRVQLSNTNNQTSKDGTTSPNDLIRITMGATTLMSQTMGKSYNHSSKSRNSQYFTPWFTANPRYFGITNKHGSFSVYSTYRINNNATHNIGISLGNIKATKYIYYDYNYRQNVEPGIYGTYFRGWDGYIHMFVYPSDIKIAYTSGSNQILPESQKIKIEAPSGYDNSVYYWQYSKDDGNTWNSFSSGFQNNRILQISAMDLFSTKAQLMAFLDDNTKSGNIQIRLRYDSYKDTYLYTTYDYSSYLTLSVYISAPGITEYERLPVKCYNGNDGQIKLKLDRALLSNEELEVFVNSTSYAKTTTLPPDNTFLIEGLTAKKHEIQVSSILKGNSPTYSDGANHSKSIFVYGPSTQLDYSVIMKKDISCFDGNDGFIKIGASGGNTGYKLHWKKKDETSFATRNFISTYEILLENLTAGIYEFYVTDANDCDLRDINGDIKKIEVSLAQPTKALDFNIKGTPMQPSGHGLSNGAITIEGDGGTPDVGGNYTVVWKNKTTGLVLTDVANSIVAGKFQSMLFNLSKGVYVAEITDDKGCTQQVEYTLDEPEALVANIENTLRVLCNGDKNAELVAHVLGGVLPTGQIYSYQWYIKDGVSYQPMATYTDSIAPNLGKGDYRIEIKDHSRIPNAITRDFSITEPQQLSTVLVKQDVTCFEKGDGFIEIQVAGGVGGYTLYYKKKNDASYQSMTVNVGNDTFLLDNLANDEYLLYITDTNNCIAPILGNDLASVVITQPAKALEIATATIVPVSGFNRSDGNISVKIDGGSPNSALPYYIVSWKDENGISVSSTEKLDTDGNFISEIDGLTEGIYSIEIKDSNYTGVVNSCYVAATFTVTQPEPLVVSLENANGVYCYGENTGRLVAHAQGGVPRLLSSLPYNYKWYEVVGGSETFIANQTDSIIDGLSVGFYKVKIEDYSNPVNTIESPVFEIEQPPLLITTLSTRNVSCFDGDDGYIHIAVQGGVGGYRLFCKQIGVDRAEAEYPIEADNKTFKLNRLIAGKYEIHINDTNGCYAQIQGQDITTIEIIQPNKALEIVKMEKIEPSGFGRSDGSITLYINGGTPNPNNTYNLTWKNKQGQVILVTTQGNFIGGQFVSTLSNQPDGEYTVEVRDGNYNIAYPDANTCCFVIATYKLTEPKKLIAGIEETHYVSCNGRSDGELIAHVTGGIVNSVSTQLPYKYQWYKEDNGSFVALVNERDSVLTNRETGNYKVEIEDYSRIVNQISISYLLVQPDVLTATSTQKHITCGQTTEVKAFPVGGTAPYSYEWNTGETTQALQDRHPGKYFVFITDSRGCETTAISHITTPGNLEVSGTYRDPVCYQAQDGSITLSVAGGTAPYTYEWSNGATTKDLNNVGAGFYSVVVTDKDGCSYSESFILEDPEQLTVNIGEDRTLCNGQELTLTPEVKDPNTKFNWTSTNGFKSSNPSVTIKDAGEYVLTIADTKGCTASDKMTLNVNYTDISSEIVVASQVYVNDTIAIVNISNPEPDRVEWLFNKEDSIKVVQEEQHFARIIFPETGQYSIGIRSYVGDCYQDIIKTITVIEPDDILNDRFKESLIDDFYIAPNPNDGKFQAIIKLNGESAIRLRVINFFNGTTISDRSFNGQSEYEIDYSLNNIGSGNLYLILLETSAGQMVFKMLGK